MKTLCILCEKEFAVGTREKHLREDHNIPEEIAHKLFWTFFVNKKKYKRILSKES